MTQSAETCSVIGVGLVMPTGTRKGSEIRARNVNPGMVKGIAESHSKCDRGTIVPCDGGGSRRPAAVAAITTVDSQRTSAVARMAEPPSVARGSGHGVPKEGPEGARTDVREQPPPELWGIPAPNALLRCTCCGADYRPDAEGRNDHHATVLRFLCLYCADTRCDAFPGQCSETYEP